MPTRTEDAVKRLGTACLLGNLLNLHNPRHSDCHRIFQPSSAEIPTAASQRNVAGSNKGVVCWPHDGEAISARAFDPQPHAGGPRQSCSAWGFEPCRATRTAERFRSRLRS
jgi:hypothetical protein